jgi:hypothetical protein
MQKRAVFSGAGLLVAVLAGGLSACGAEPAANAYSVGGLPTLENGIIGGKKSTARDFPATGVILFTTERAEGMVGSMLCSGTLVAPDVVTAAGHCNLALFVDTDKPIDYYFSTKLDVSDFGPKYTHLPEHTVKVAKMVAHPEFELENVGVGLRETKDIALLFLEEPITDVEPAKIMTREEAELLKEGADVDIVGYGRRHVFPLGRRDVGIKYQGPSTIKEMGEFEMQIGSGGDDAHKCHGDSGGPTYMVVGKGTRRAHTALIGITSHAYDHSDCWNGGVDTRIDRYLDWIEDTMASTCADGSRPACPSESGDRQP